MIKSGDSYVLLTSGCAVYNVAPRLRDYIPFRMYKSQFYQLSLGFLQHSFRFQHVFDLAMGMVIMLLVYELDKLW